MRFTHQVLLSAALLLILVGCANESDRSAADTQQSGSSEPSTIALFNGTDIDDWIVKIRGHELGDNYANTFRVEDGLLKIRYDGYGGSLNEQFGHLYYKTPFSHYRLVVEYRFVGDWLPDTPGWARRNNGIMFHTQDPATLGLDQDFPISVEAQLLGGLSDGNPRSTANLCTPGTDVVMNGQLETRHCIESSSATYDGDQWVRIELEVLGDSLITHIVEGDTVLQYQNPTMGSGTINGFDPAMFKPGEPVDSGFIAVQAEGHPTDFRRIELTPLR